MCLFCVCVVLFVGAGQRPCDGLIPRPRRTTDCVKKIADPKKKASAQQRAVEPLMNEKK
jgi:hypothetical protein